VYETQQYGSVRKAPSTTTDEPEYIKQTTENNPPPGFIPVWPPCSHIPSYSSSGCSSIVDRRSGGYQRTDIGDMGEDQALRMVGVEMSEEEIARTGSAPIPHKFYSEEFLPHRIGMETNCECECNGRLNIL